MDCYLKYQVTTTTSMYISAKEFSHKLIVMTDESYSTRYNKKNRNILKGILK